MNGHYTDANKSVAQLTTLIVNIFIVFFKSTLYMYLHQIYELYVYIFCILIFTFSPFTMNV